MKLNWQFGRQIVCECVVYEQKSDFSVGNNLFGELSDITDQQSFFYSDAIPETLF